jgi:hypothetical protein
MIGSIPSFWLTKLGQTQKVVLIQTFHMAGMILIDLSRGFDRRNLETLKFWQTGISGLWAYRLIDIIVSSVEKERKTKMMMGKFSKKAIKK